MGQAQAFHLDDLGLRPPVKPCVDAASCLVSPGLIAVKYDLMFNQRLQIFDELSTERLFTGKVLTEGSKLMILKCGWDIIAVSPMP